MNGQADVEREIESATINLHGKFWAFIMQSFARNGQVDLDGFLKEMSEFMADSPNLSQLERSILGGWYTEISNVANSADWRPRASNDA